MTREELKEHCKKQVESCEMWAKAKGEEPRGRIYEEHKLILELLEQQPCEDCISREQAKVAIRDRFKDLPSRVEINTILNELPSVTPQPKTGHWIDKFGGEYRCSCCREIISIDTEIEHPNGITYKYCPNCGAKMEVEE